MFLPDGYPTEKPVIFFEDLTDSKGKDHVFEHVNVFQDPRGRLCLEAIQDNYASSMTLADILAVALGLVRRWNDASTRTMSKARLTEHSQG